MTTFATGNALGSTAVKDLYDNAQNLDDFVNGPLDYYPDRLGVERLSYRGIENQANTALVNTGFDEIGDYDADGPLTITRRNQVFTHAGQFYSASAGLTLPYTTVGNWTTDAPKFVNRGDFVLRQDLSQPTGATLIGAKTQAGIPTTVQAILNSITPAVSVSKNVRDFGAVGDGVANDTQAFKDALAAALSSKSAVFIPAGSYLVSGGLSMGSGTLNLCVYGEGRASRIKFAATSSLFKATGLVGEITFKDFIIDNVGTSTDVAVACFDFPEGNTNTDFVNINCLPNLATNKTVPSFYLCAAGKTNDSINFVNCYMHVNKRGIQTGAGSSVFIFGGRVIGFDPLTENSIGIGVQGGMGGVWIVSTDIIGLSNGVAVSPGSGASNREVFLNGTCIDSCDVGLLINDAGSYVNWEGVWAASCYSSNISYAPTSDASVFNMSGGTIFNAGGNDSGTGHTHYGLSVNRYGRLLATGITFRNNKNRGLSCNDGARSTDAIITGCQFFANGTNGRASSTQVFLAGQVVFEDNRFIPASGVPSVTIDAGSIAPASIRNNRGYKGVALRSVPAITGSNVDVTNSTGQAVTVYLRGGAVASVSLNGNAIFDQGTAARANLSFNLEPLDVFRVVYTTVPDMQWYFN